MGSEREVACIYYKWEGECKKGREGTFRKACQTCKKYKAKKGSLPVRSIKLKREVSLPARILKNKRQRKLESMIWSK